MLSRHVYVRIALVVPKSHIEMRLVLLYEVVLEQQRLCFGIRDRDFYFSNRCFHRSRLGRRLRTMKISGHAFLQVTRLANVDDLVLRVEHAVDARTVRQAA